MERRAKTRSAQNQAVAGGFQRTAVVTELGRFGFLN